MTLRVAIVGAGPKGFYALERLLAHLRAAPGGSVRIDVYEPETPGAGPAYAPELPPALLMNLRSDLIDAWPRTGALAVNGDDRPGLVAWAAQRGTGVDEYAPRAVVGEYLRGAFEQVVSDGAAVADVRIFRERADQIKHDATRDRWVVHVVAGRPSESYDEVLLATGHGPLPPAEVFDARRLSRLPITAGMVVATRGFGLTTLDLIRLMESRELLDAAAPVHAVSRSGRPPLAKPSRKVELELRARCSPTAGGAGWPAAGRLTTAFIREVLVQEALRVLHAGTAFGARSDQLVRTELAEIEARRVVTAGDAIARLQRSVDAASGRTEPDAATALGVAWRATQAAVVEHGSFGAFAPGELFAFRGLAAALELVGFGPPLASATTLLTALESGTVRSWSAPARLETRGDQTVLVTPADEQVTVDLALDTVLPAPGVRSGSPLQPLVDAGLASVAAEGRGVRIAPDGTALRPSGRVLRGLAVIGRPTEDWVLGNDTLMRETHEVAECWGARVARRATTDGEAHGGAPAGAPLLAAAGGEPA